MAVKLLVNLDAPDSALAGYGAGAVVRVQSSATEGGTYANVTTKAIVAGAYQYEVWDFAGDRTTWYRWRVEAAGATPETGEYSDPLQGWDPAVAGRLSGSYAHPDEALLRVDTRPTTAMTAKLARLDRALVTANERLTDELAGTSFWRIPQTGATEVRTFDGDGSAVLHVHGGIVSLSGVRVKLNTFADFDDIDDADWRLEYWADRGSPHAKTDAQPWDHVVLTGAGTQRYWPRVAAGVELTGALGWPKAPARARDAEIDLARQSIAADPIFAGSIVGPGGDLGRPQGPNMLPRSVYDLTSAMSRRFLGCDL